MGRQVKCPYCGKLYDSKHHEICPKCRTEVREREERALYLGGHPFLTNKELGKLVVGEKGIFFYRYEGRHILEEPTITFEYNLIEGVKVETKEQIQGRVTATRIAMIGMFALAVPKRERAKSYLTIDYPIEGETYTVVFETLKGQQMANLATSYLHPYLKERSAVKTSDTKTCPYCAETIKVAAIKCRYCGSDFGE